VFRLVEVIMNKERAEFREENLHVRHEYVRRSTEYGLCNPKNIDINMSCVTRMTTDELVLQYQTKCSEMTH
jgi:hypothetical protein